MGAGGNQLQRRNDLIPNWSRRPRASPSRSATCSGRLRSRGPSGARRRPSSGCRQPTSRARAGAPLWWSKLSRPQIERAISRLMDELAGTENASPWSGCGNERVQRTTRSGGGSRRTARPASSVQEHASSTPAGGRKGAAGELQPGRRRLRTGVEPVCQIGLRCRSSITFCPSSTTRWRPRASC